MDTFLKSFFVARSIVESDAQIQLNGSKCNAVIGTCVCEANRKCRKKEPDPNYYTFPINPRCSYKEPAASWQELKVCVCVCLGVREEKTKQGTHLVCGAIPPSRSPRPSCWTEEDSRCLRGRAKAPKPTISFTWARSLL